MHRRPRHGSSHEPPRESSQTGARGNRTLTESLPPIQAKAVAQLMAAGPARNPHDKTRPVPVARMEATVQQRLHDVLIELGACTRDRTLALFTQKELEVRYASDDTTRSLSELIHMLFDPTDPRRRRQAVDFLTPILG